MCQDTDNQQPKPPDLGTGARAGAPSGQARPASAPLAKPKTEAMVRDARLKAALKANMARRKGQARARASTDVDPTDIEKNE